MLLSIESLHQKINKEIENYKVGNEPPSLYEPINYILGLGGKRLRPLLVLLSHHLFADDYENALTPALAVEVFHNFTLMHDDIMDNAPLRRGKSTVHEKWNSNIAILSGDVMLVKAYDLLLSIENKYLKKILTSFNVCATGVCEGQQMDVDFERVSGIGIDQYIRMITLKTAVLLGFCAELGAIIGEAPEQDSILMRDFGINLGIAFQLKDDLLDVFGDKDKFGKKVGGDIIAKKKTFLLIKALELAKGNELKFLTTYLKDDKQPSEKDVNEISSIYKKLGIEKITGEKIEKYFDQAYKCLAEVKTDLYRKSMLKSFIAQLMAREN
jgi:geranylgeranyl diphosphate synthase type II